MGIGTIMGSAIFNILVIIGSSGVFSGYCFSLDWKPILRDVFFNLLSFAYLLYVFWDSRVDLFESILGITVYLLYVLSMAVNKYIIAAMDAVAQSIKRAFISVKLCLGYEHEEVEMGELHDLEQPHKHTKSTKFEVLDGSDDTPDGVETGLLYGGDATEAGLDDKELGSGDADDSGESDDDGDSSDDNDEDEDDEDEQQKRSLAMMPTRKEIFEEYERSRGKKESSSKAEVDSEGVDDASESDESEGVAEGNGVEESPGPAKRNQRVLARMMSRSGEVFSENYKVDKVEAFEEGEFKEEHRPHRHLTPEEILAAAADDDDLDSADNCAAKCVITVRNGFRKILHILMSPYVLAYKYTVPNVDIEREGIRKYAFVLSFIMCIMWIAVETWCMVEFATKAGCIMHFKPAVLGFTLLAIGTSLPDCLASVSVARVGLGNMAVCNALGSNVFDITFALSWPWVVSILMNGTLVVEAEEIVKYVLILTSVLGFLIATFIFVGWQLTRKVGFVLYVVYAVFVLYALLDEMTSLPI
eukprot:TRINITY_DN9799_c0_g1_i1.p1 TRINITY_DN9799_c0_g1~~TRINITY_DN9799_c0_g1_i1.p1  ORF type:complete len:529 (+),score=87.03 TRINITY_DN9799_c0_g1_i1:83-1669(+)